MSRGEFATGPPSGRSVPMVLFLFLFCALGASALLTTVAGGDGATRQIVGVSAQGYLQVDGRPHLAAGILETRSPSGAYRLVAVPAGGAIGAPVFDLQMQAIGGPTELLPGVRGDAFWIDDRGRIITVEAPEAVAQPARVSVLDPSGEVVFRRNGIGMIDPALSPDGRWFIHQGLEEIVLTDLERLESIGLPALARFCVGEGGRVAGVGDRPMDGRVRIDVYRRGVLETSLLTESYPRRLAFAPGGEALIVMEGETARLLPLNGDAARTLYTAPQGEELRDLRVVGNNVVLGLCISAPGEVRGKALFLDSAGGVVGSVSGERREAPAPRPSGARETIPWPLQPNAQHPIGNTYGEYQNYGGAPYMHPGVDVMGAAGQPVYAVRGGEVKAVLTTSGEWHWRVAVADETGPELTPGYLYAHIDPATIAVEVGDIVTEGQYLGDLVEWPVYEFHHCHFARIESSGWIWQGNWLCIGNPHLDFQNQSETEPPVFENALGTDLFAFCTNQTSNYLDPQQLSGEVDIIVRAGDHAESAWLCTVQRLRYTIYPQGFPDAPVVNDLLAIEFDMDLDTYQGGPIDPFLVQLLYKDDSVCNTYGDYDRREYYYIMTNSNGDLVYEESDLWESWDTTLLPDADYVVRVTAQDAAGNTSVDSMVVRTQNGNPSSAGEVEVGGPWVRTVPNPTRGGCRFVLGSPGGAPVALTIFDAEGRTIRHLRQDPGPGGRSSIEWNGYDEAGGRAPAGIYFYRAEAVGWTRAGKVVVMR